MCETSAPAGFTTDSADCNDAATTYVDGDGDGFGAGSAAACGVTVAGDCDDADASASPSGIELCSNLAIDNDCNGSVLESEATDRLTFYADTDNDGAGDAASTTLACSVPAGYVSNSTDGCPANASLTAPATWYADTDGDGAGDAASTQSACAQPAGYVGVAGDGCPTDSNKLEPGTCGCGIADADADGDGAADCNDGCPNDVNKTAPGVCGCGTPDSDEDGDGVVFCQDNCPTVANADQANCDADTLGNACDADDDNDGASDINDAYACNAAKSDIDAAFSVEQITALLGSMPAATVDATGMTFAQLVAVADNTANIAHQGIGGSFTLTSAYSDVRIAALLAKAKPATGFVGGANIAIDATGMTSAQLGAVATGIAAVSTVENLSLDASFSATTIAALVSKTPAGEAAINATGMSAAQLAASVSGANAVSLTGTISIDAGLNAAQIAEITGSTAPGSIVNVDSTGMSAAQQAALLNTASLIVDADAAVTSGDTFTVEINIANMPVPAVGVQACVTFNNQVLEYVPNELGVGGVDFPVQIFEFATANTVSFGTGIDLGGDGTGILSGNVARLTFRAIAPICGATDLISFVQTGFVNRISSQAPAGGNSLAIPFTAINLTNISNFNTTLFTGVPAGDTTVPADAGNAVGAVLTEPVVVASNNCGSLPVVMTVEYPLSTGLANGSTWPAVFPVGTTAVTWEVTDARGAVLSEMRLYTVEDYQLATIDVNLIGGINAGLSYTLPIRVRLSSGHVMTANVAFQGNNGAVTDIQVPVRGDYSCISVKDATHTVSAAQQMLVTGTKYTMAAPFALVAGDSNDDNLVDVLDFGSFVSDRGVGKNAQSRSNFDRNQVVNNGDFAFISLNFLRTGDLCGGGYTGNAPLERVSVKELRRAGLGHMAEADINNDGWVDTADMALAMQGIYRRDVPGATEATDETGSTQW